MGLFGKKVCVKCGKECGMFGSTSTEDEKVLCSDCAKLAGKEFSSYDHTYEQYLAMVERYNENEKKLQKFHIDKVYYNRIFVDTANNWIAVTKYSVYKKENMYKEHPHIYDAKDLMLFNQGVSIKKQEPGVFKTTVYVDFSTMMVFEDEFVPCPLNEVVESGRKVEVKGVFKQKAEGLYTQADLEIFNYATEILNAKGLERPAEMEKGDKVESLDKYAAWFKMLFDLEKRKILNKKHINTILENLVENMGTFEKVKMPEEIRKRFGA